jgi:hypothetical protein
MLLRALGTEIMRRAIALLFTVAIMAVLVQQASATIIVVFDSNGYHSPNAKVLVYGNGQLIKSGYTDNSGIFYYGLSCNANYQIDASGYGQSGNWQGNCPGDEIDIYMH